MANAKCPHCRRVALAASGELGSLIFQNKLVTVVAGDHQYFPGYVVVISNTHVREMHHLDDETAAAIFRDVLRVGGVIEKGFSPLKLNYASLGNIDEHLHWHVFPRYSSDPDHKDHPWKNAALFPNFPTTAADMTKLRQVFESSV